MNLALDNGVKPGDISELIIQMIFYSGWGNATSAAAVAKNVFKQREINCDQLPAALSDLPTLDEAAEAQRASEKRLVPILAI